MSYDKFKANVMAAKIIEERDRVAVFPSLTNREYEGIVKNVGDTVTIKGAGKIAMTSSSDGKPILLSDPGVIEGTNAILSIKEQRAFNFMVPDIDSAQGAKGALSVYERQAGVQLANEHDKFIADLAADPLAVNLFNSVTLVDNTTVLAAIDSAVQKLYENDVPATEKMTMVVSPRFWTLVRQNLDAIDTDNSDMLKRGALGMYNGVDIKMSNNVHTSGTGGANDHIILMTKQAIAFVDAITKIEGKRANNYMADEIRGLSLFGAKIIRPKEMVVLNVKYA